MKIARLTSPLPSSVIAKAKAEAWQTTCSSLSPKSNPNSVYSLLRSVAGSSFSFSFSPNFPNCCSPRKSDSVFAHYLRPQFSIFQSKAQQGRARGYLSKPRVLKSLTRPFVHPSPKLNFLRLSPTSPRPLPLVQRKLPIPCQSTFLALAWIFSFTFSILPGPCILFVSAGRHLLLFQSIRWESLSTLRLPSGLFPAF